MKKHSVLFVGARALVILGAFSSTSTFATETDATPSTELGTLVVNATKLDKDEDRLTQSTTVITSQDIQQKNYTDTTEILRETAGIQFKQAGGPGQFNYTKMRGFSAGNILLVIDGVKVNHAGSGDFGNLIGQIDPNSIERIEVLRGPQASLYGSNSTAGVISITTKSGSKPDARIATEVGSLDWRKTKLSLNNNHDVGDGNLSYSLNVSKTDSNGVIDDEYYKDNSIQAKVSYSTDQFEVGGSYWRTDNKFQYAELLEAGPVNSWDRYYSLQLPDPDSTRALQQTISSVWATHHITDKLSHTLKLGQMEENDQNLDLDNGLLGYMLAPYNNFTVDYFNFYNKGAVVPIYDSGSAQAANARNLNRQLDYTLKYSGEKTNALFGFERVTQNYRSWGRWGNSPSMDDSTNSLYINADHTLVNDHLVLSVGLRNDNYDSWGSQTTGNIGAAWNFTPGTGIFANYGTSYKAPTLSQLFDQSYGSDALTPESGKTTEIGFRQKLLDEKLAWDITAWQTQLDDVIIFDYSIPNPAAPWGFGKYANGDKQRTSGAELNGSYALTNDWTLYGNYTYTDSHIKKEGADYKRTVQIARNTANAGLRYKKGKLETDLGIYYTGPRLRWAADLETDSFVRTDISARYHATDAISVYGRVENLFNQDVTEEIGYKQPGRYGVIGVEYRFF